MERRQAFVAGGMIALFAALFSLGQFHRVAQGTVTPLLQSELQLSAFALGTISAVLYFSSAAMQLPAGILLDRFGARRVVPALLLVGILGSFLYAIGHSAAALILARTLIGFGYAAVLIGAFVIFARWFPPDRFARIASLMLAAGSVGGLIATAPLSLAIASVGWRPVFVGVAVLTALLGLMVFLLARDAPPGYRASVPAPASLREAVTGLGEVIRHRQMRYVLSIGLVGYGPVTTILGLWGAPFLSDAFGADAATRGYVLFAMALATPIGLLMVGSLDRRFNTRKGVILVMAIAQAGLLLLLAISGDRSFWLAALVFPGIALLQAFNVVTAAHCRALFPDHMVGRANTMLNLSSILGLAIMQQLSGVIIGLFPPAQGIGSTPAYQAMFAVLALMVLLAVFAYAQVEDVPPQPRTILSRSP